uniref:WD repeat-containing protein 46 n=1 Tax=Ascaris suum TaxID=6253 RepID=F1KWN2_ASCSU
MFGPSSFVLFLKQTLSCTLTTFLVCFLFRTQITAVPSCPSCFADPFIAKRVLRDSGSSGASVRHMFTIKIHHEAATEKSASMDESKGKTEVMNYTAEDLTPSGGFSTKLKRRNKIKSNFERTFPRKRAIQRRIAKDRFPDHAPVFEGSIQKHDTGASEINPKNVRTEFHQAKLEMKKKKFLERIQQTARAEILNSEDAGYLVTDDGELSYTIRQKDICASVDMASATKHFDLDLERFGPYRIDYTLNGRHLLIGGKRGHVAAFDWLTKSLHNETNVMEGVRDVQWLHVETMYAVAQKRWTYIYDNMGVELHCLKMLHDIKRMEFLPRHFLLVAGSNTSFLSYLDVSIGKLVQSFATRQGALDVMTQNPSNAIIHTGHGNGTVQLWSPNIREPLVKMLAHKSSVRGIAVEGNYMATTGLDRRLRIWDVRNYKQLFVYVLPFGLSEVAFSQRYTIACAVGNSVQVFTDAHLGTAREPYLVHNCRGIVSDLRFCPFEDVLGVGHQGGFTSLLVPGCGEANFNALHANPYESKSQRKEREVKQLLDKIQPELITLDTSEIAQVNTSLMEQENERLKNVLYVRPRDVKFTPKHKKKGRSGALKKEQRKQGVQAEMRFAVNEERKRAESELFGSYKPKIDDKPKSVLDRFKRKDA